MTAKPIIETRGLVMRFGGVEVLSGIDFAIDYGAVSSGLTAPARAPSSNALPAS
jgi:ABC-type branched-subunit amino acid transport system ATPase component